MNKGWKCTECGQTWMFTDYTHPADEGLKHIKEEHPLLWNSAEWSLVAIKGGSEPS